MMKLRLSRTAKRRFELGTVLTDKLWAGLSLFLPLFGSQFLSAAKEGTEQNNLQP